MESIEVKSQKNTMLVWQRPLDLGETSIVSFGGCAQSVAFILTFTTTCSDAKTLDRGEICETTRYMCASGA